MSAFRARAGSTGANRRRGRPYGRHAGRLGCLVAATAFGLLSTGSGTWAADEASPATPTSLVPHSALDPSRPAATDRTGQSGPTAARPSRPAAGLAPSAIGQPTFQGVEVNPLAEITPDSLGILDPDSGGFGVDMWRGSERAVVERLLRRLPDHLRSPATRDLARRLLLSIAAPPAGTADTGEQPAAGLLALRVERLAALGEVDGLNQLLAVVPSSYDDEFISRTRVDSLLLTQDFSEACRRVRNGIAVFHQLPYWQKAMVFCHMAEGEVDKGLLGLDLLREQGAPDDPAFFALASRFIGAQTELPADADLAPLHFAMLQVGEGAVPLDLHERASPALLYALAHANGAAVEQRASAAEWACAAGIVHPDVLAEIYRAFTFSPDEIAGAISAVDWIEGPKIRALLYQAARDQSVPAARAEVLRIALERAEQADLYQAVVAVALPLLSEIEPRPELAWFATTAGRALYASGRYEAASAWLILGRQEAIIDPQASAAVATLWPYSRLAGGAALTTDGSLAAWRAMHEGMGDQGLGRRQSLLRASFQALGERDPLPWNKIAAYGEAVSRTMPDAALLYALEEASEARRVGETVLLSLIVLGETGPAESHTLALGTVLSALGRVGLDQEARAIAIEAALANGV